MSHRPDAVPFVTGQAVRTTCDLEGIKQGSSAEHGDGQPGVIPVGALCEVFTVLPGGLIIVHHDLVESGPREPYRIQAEAFASELTAASSAPIPSDTPPDL